MEDVIELLRERNEPVPVPLELPDMDDVVTVQEEMLIHLPADYRDFLLEVSDVVYGNIEPATIADPRLHTYLPDMAALAWDRGMPRYLIPVCEHAEGYYAVDPDGEVMLWTVGHAEEDDYELTWPNVWAWARDVWLGE